VLRGRHVRDPREQVGDDLVAPGTAEAESLLRCDTGGRISSNGPSGGTTKVR
jgi:hypothetical protein